MSNNLKEIMKKEFDKNKNYNEILSKIERVDSMKKLNNKNIFGKSILKKVITIASIISLFIGGVAIAVNFNNIIKYFELGKRN